jgi:hypothetical protein
METLKRYKLGELKQLAVYLEEFQDCQFVDPTDARKKKCWLKSVNTMITEKNPESPSSYIIKLREIIRWFLDHRFKFTRGRGDTFFVTMTSTFLYDITETIIHLEDSLTNIFEIDRSYMNLSKYSAYIQANPTNRNVAGNWVQNFFDETRGAEESSHYEYMTTHWPAHAIEHLFDKPKSSSELKLNIIDEESTDETRGLECKICTINKICVVLTKCGHAFCYSCTTRFENKCATCRTPFMSTSVVQMFI